MESKGSENVVVGEASSNAGDAGQGANTGPQHKAYPSLLLYEKWLENGGGGVAEPVCITEKLHGANLGVHTVSTASGLQVAFQSRKYILPSTADSKTFFGFIGSTLQVQVANKAKALHHLLAKSTSLDTSGLGIIVFGELVGGAWDSHGHIHSAHTTVQREVKYCPDHAFFPFDVYLVLHGVKYRLSVEDTRRLCDVVGFSKPPLLYVGSLAEAAAWNPSFNSIASVVLGWSDVPLPGNEAEGIVMRCYSGHSPVKCQWGIEHQLAWSVQQGTETLKGGSLTIKRKVGKFMESIELQRKKVKAKAQGPKKPKKAKKYTEEELAELGSPDELRDLALRHVTANRLSNILSHFGVTQSDLAPASAMFADVTKAFFQDCTKALDAEDGVEWQRLTPKYLAQVGPAVKKACQDVMKSLH